MLALEIVKWTKDYLNSFGGKTKAVIGVSGGKDSTIVLKLLIEAVGKDRVYAVTIPSIQGVDPAVEKIAKEFKIKIHRVDITDSYVALSSELDKFSTSKKECPAYYSNTPCRLRMVTLYGIAAIIGDARVVCTSNRSEDYISWMTKWGDQAGDFAPLADLTVREVKILGYQLGISSELIEKKPDDGMCGKTDEEKFGFTYSELDDYLLYGIGNKKVINKIEKMHKNGLHKLLPMPKFEFAEDLEAKRIFKFKEIATQMILDTIPDAVYEEVLNEAKNIVAVKPIKNKIGKIKYVKLPKKYSNNKRRK